LAAVTLVANNANSLVSLEIGHSAADRSAGKPLARRRPMERGWARAWPHVVFVVLSCGLGVTLGMKAEALDPHRVPSQYVVKKWGVNSLQSNTVSALLQTRDHYLWLGTSAGLIRYDGARFVIFSRENTPGFGDGGVSRLAEGADGTLYIGLISGSVLRYKDGIFTRLPFEKGTGYVSSLLVTRGGTVWAAAFSGLLLSSWRPGDASAYRPPSAPPAPHALAEDPAGGIWIGTRDRGLMRYANGKFETFNVTSEMIQALRLDHSGALWIGTRHGLVRMRGSAVARFTQKDGLAHDNVTDVLEDRQGNVWVATSGGVSRLTDGRWTRLAASVDGLSDDDVRSLLEDHEGNIWIGTANGLTALSDGAFVTYGRPEGLSRPAVTSVAGGANGRVWIGTASGRLICMQGDTSTAIDLPTGGGLESVLAIREMKDGSVWIALDNARILRLRNGAISDQTPILSGPEQQTWKVRGFFEDETGPLLLTVGAGIARLRDRHLVPLYPDIPRVYYPHIVHRDAAGVLWMGEKSGLMRFKDGKWRVFTDKDGLPHARVRWIHEDPEGGLWLATIGGLAFIKDEEVHAVTDKQGLPENFLRFVTDDGQGHLWIASTGHLMRLSKDELRELFAGKRATLTPRRFDTFDGLRTTEMTLSSNPGFRAADGRLWFATAQGASVVDPARPYVNTAPPAVHVEEVSVDSRTFDGRSAVDAPPGRGDLVIRYTGLSFMAPEKVTFRYKLDGYDSDWIDAGTRRLAIYTNLPPGQYRFRVAATNNDGVHSAAEGQLGVYLAPHFYQTAAFRGGVAIAVLLGLGGFYRRRVGALKERERELAVRVDEGLVQIKVLRGLLPTCASCKKIRDESGSWSHMESYIRDHSEANFSHSVCPECEATLYPDYHRARAGA
jgi:ligand-binding sensor domain-containing protein